MGENNGGSPDGNVWLKIAGATFGLWSLAVPIGVAIVSNSVDKLAVQQLQFMKSLEEYKLAQERRVTEIKERQDQVMRHLEYVDTRQDRIEERERVRSGK